MRPWILIAVLSASAVSSVGCVSKAQYVKVQNENERLHERVEKLDARAEAQLKAFKELLADFKPLIDRGLLKVEVVDGRITLGVASDVLFASGSSELSPAGKKDLADITRLLAKRVGDRDFQVEGHTDNEPINTAQYPTNWHLGAARAIAVTQHMIANGFPEDHVSAATFADNSPVSSNGSASGRTQNRRIEIVLLPELSDLPGYKRLMAEQNGRSRGRGKGK
ncbi:MAG: flagellar motor protein MotB [Pseudomonadota bacterium]|nr:flagellar motor protein MotB [Pseudomonadota bacterium]